MKLVLWMIDWALISLVIACIAAEFKIGALGIVGMYLIALGFVEILKEK